MVPNHEVLHKHWRIKSWKTKQMRSGVIARDLSQGIDFLSPTMSLSVRKVFSAVVENYHTFSNDLINEGISCWCVVKVLLFWLRSAIAKTSRDLLWKALSKGMRVKITIRLLRVPATAVFHQLLQRSCSARIWGKKRQYQRKDLTRELEPYVLHSGCVPP